jgi:hypothetical protein
MNEINNNILKKIDNIKLIDVLECYIKIIDSLVLRHNGWDVKII